MSFIDEFQKAYEASKISDINFMNEFCTKWAYKADLEQIPYFMKLFNDYALNSEQNEFVADVLNNIVKKDIINGIRIIIESMNILSEENSTSSILHVLCILVFWNKSYLENTAREFARYENSLEEEIRQIVFMEIDEDPISEQFYFYYNNEKGKLK